METEGQQLSLSEYIFKHLNVFHVRITKHGHTNPKSRDMLSEFSHFIIATEGDGIEVKRHQHILVGDSDKSKISKEILQQLCKDTYSVKGNPDYSVKVVRDRKALASYVLKEDDDALVKGFTKVQVAEFIKRSYDKDEFTKGYKTLKEQLDDGELLIGDYSNRLLNLKAKCGQPISMRSHQNHILSQLVKQKILNPTSLTFQVLRNLGMVEFRENLGEFFLGDY